MLVLKEGDGCSILIVFLLSGVTDFFFYFSTKPYFVGTEKNRLNETVVLSTKKIC